MKLLSQSSMGWVYVDIDIIKDDGLFLSDWYYYIETATGKVKRTSSEPYKSLYIAKNGFVAFLKHTNEIDITIKDVEENLDKVIKQAKPFDIEENRRFIEREREEEREEEREREIERKEQEKQRIKEIRETVKNSKYVSGEEMLELLRIENINMHPRTAGSIRAMGKVKYNNGVYARSSNPITTKAVVAIENLFNKLSK